MISKQRINQVSVESESKGTALTYRSLPPIEIELQVHSAISMMIQRLLLGANVMSETPRGSNSNTIQQNK